jgi:hypothetical protein
MAARVDQDNVQLFTRSGLDWTAKYPATAAAMVKLPVKSAYLDRELCGVRPNGVTSFELMQVASDAGLGVFRAIALRTLKAIVGPTGHLPSSSWGSARNEPCFRRVAQAVTAVTDLDEAEG